MVRKASAVWKGGLKDGQGKVGTASGAVANVTYNFAQRFEDAPGTNPEELVAAAHAACFAMAFSGDLGKADLKPESIEVEATLTFERVDGRPTVTRIHLDARATVPGAAESAVLAAAESAKKNCPISRLLATEITLSCKLV